MAIAEFEQTKRINGLKTGQVGMEVLWLAPPENTLTGSKDLKAWYSINDLLGRHESFAQDSKVTQYVQRRLDHISSGKKIEAVVIHDNDPNGFAMPGYIVVTDGLLKLIKTQEELDGFLAHEYTHIEAGHVEEFGPVRPIEKVGRRRSHEVEADLKPLELLDQKGINPVGLIDLSTKMESGLGDVEHGTLLDRRLNLKQMAWVVDIRNLSNRTTPLEISEENLQDYQKDDDLWEKFDGLNSLSKRHFLQRQFQRIPIFGNEWPEQDRVRVEKLVQWQRQLLRDQAPDLTEHQLERLVAITVVAGYGVPNEEKMPLAGEMTTLDNWFRKTKDTDEVLYTFSLTQHRVLSGLGIQLEDRSLTDIGNACLFGVLQAEEGAINFDAHFELVRKLEQFHSSDEYYYVPLIETLLKRKIFNFENARVLASHLVNAPVLLERVEDYLSECIDMEEVHDMSDNQIYEGTGMLASDYEDGFKEGAVEVPIEASAAMVLIRTIQRARAEKAYSLSDPVEIFIALSKISGEVGDRELYEFMEDLSWRISIGQLIDSLEKYAKGKNIELFREEFVRLIVDAYREEKIESIEDKLKEPPEAIEIAGLLLPDRLLLWAITMDKTDYLTQVNEDLYRVNMGQFNSLDRIWQLVNDIKSAPQIAKERGFRIDWEVTLTDLKGLEPLLSQARLVYLRDGNISEAVKRLPIWGGARGEVQDTENWERVAKKILRGKELGDKKLLELFALGCLANNTQVLLQVPSRAIEELVKRFSFDDGLALMFETYGHMPKHIFLRALDHLIEEKANTIAEFEQLDAIIRAQLSAFLRDEGLIGRLALADTFLEYYRPMGPRKRDIGIIHFEVRGLESMQLLQTLFQTAKSDEAFKRYVFERWWGVGRMGTTDNPLFRYFKIEDIVMWRSKPANLIQNWMQELPQGTYYRPLSRYVTDAFLADLGMKHAILRKVLTGKKGALESVESRQQLADIFFANWVNFEGQQGEQIAKELVNALMEAGSQEELYLRLSPLLAEMILKAPADQFPYTKLSFEVAHQSLWEMKQNGTLSAPTTRDRDILTVKILNLMLSGKEETVMNIDQTTSRLLALLKDEREESPGKVLTPWELAILVGTKAGAPGVRILQLAGQYFDVPAEVRSKLMDVYDSVKGQSRLQAYRVLRREAQAFPEIAQLLDNIEEIRPRIGGGSLVTVYDVLLRDGSRQAVAVRNPNVEYNLGETINLLQRTIRNAQEKSPGDRRYQLLEVLLDDVQQWLVDELNDPTFELKDIRFRQQNDTELGNFSPGRNKYGILVPRSVPTGTRWVRREEFIDGKNLTSLQITDKPTNIRAGVINREDYRQMASLIVRNYVHQLLVTGLAHSDVHPGNFRVTMDNAKVAIFDRYNLLELNDNERKFIKGLITSLGRGVAGFREKFVDYVLSLEENRGLVDAREAILSELRGVENAVDMEKTVINSIITMKQRGVKIPLKITLIGKNIQVLNRMAREAGFESLKDAFMYTSSPIDALKMFI